MAEDFTPKKNELTNQDAMAIPDSTHAQDSASVALPAFDGLKKPGKISLNKRGPELPIDGLPPSVIRYIEKVCEIYHCPREFVTCSVLATAATATGKKIKINEGKYKNSLVLWFVFVARSGSNKSYPIKLISAPLRKIDAELYEAYQTELAAYLAVPAKERDGNEPRCKAIVIDDCTDERRSEILYLNNKKDEDSQQPYSDKRGAIGIYPELKGMFDSKNQYQNGGTAGISKLLRLFDCEDIKVDRRSGYTMLIKDPFCNIIGDLQTGLLRATFGSELYMTNGLNQRFLFCFAEDIDYPDRSHETLPYAIAKEWEDTVTLLYRGIYRSGDEIPATLFRCTDGIVTLSEGADRVYNTFYNALQSKKRQTDNDYIASIYSKLQIQVLRYAGIVHALEVAEEKGQRADYSVIHESTMEYAVRCMDYFEHMALTVYAKLTEAPEVKPSSEMTNAELLRALKMKFPDISQGEIARLIHKSPAYVSKVMNQK